MAVESPLQGFWRSAWSACVAVEHLLVLASGLIFNSRRQHKAICSSGAIVVLPRFSFEFTFFLRCRAGLSPFQAADH